METAVANYATIVITTITVVSSQGNAINQGALTRISTHHFAKVCNSIDHIENSTIQLHELKYIILVSM